MRSISIFVLFTITGFAYDCAPKTFTTLTHLLLRPVKEEIWTKEFFPNGEKQAPDVKKTLEIWNRQIPDIHLVVIFSAYQTDKTTLSVSENVPYFWVGYPARDTVTSNNDDQVHACLIYFYSNQVCMINTIHTREIDNKTVFDFYIETISFKDFLERTIYIFELQADTPPVNICTINSLLFNK